MNDPRMILSRVKGILFALYRENSIVNNKISNTFQVNQSNQSTIHRPYIYIHVCLDLCLRGAFRLSLRFLELPLEETHAQPRLHLSLLDTLEAMMALH